LTSADQQVVIIGAGPYGLAIAAHLRARGVEPYVFGHTMSFWESHMPRGMLLRSAWHASSISDPHGHMTLDAYEAQSGRRLPRPLSRSEFVSYGRWFQRAAVPNLDTRMVSAIEQEGNDFAVELEEGERMRARRVVVATGLRRFPHRPREFEQLEPELAPHSMDVIEPDRFRGRSIAVIGSGQSAVETAALVHEAGGEVELIARAPAIRWLTRSARLHGGNRVIEYLLYAPTDVGPPGVSWVVALPNAFRRLPRKTQDRLAYRAIRPAAAGWLVDRTGGVKLTLGRRVVAAAPEPDGVTLTLDDGSARSVDGLVLGTGYSVDVKREPVLGSSIRDRISLNCGHPVLRRGMESTVPGLHFVGAYAAYSFGPVMRFVSGTKFSARNVAEQIARRR
jgi:cation diffusion facilitator CzcD-associated flavoprotein CzcO